MKTFFAFALFLSFSHLSWGQNGPTALIEGKIKSNGLKKSSLGLIISSTGASGAPLYSLNESKLFIPASLAKIATLSALYHFYPPSLTFKTAFISSADIKEGALKGDLILKGGGDPGFTSESLWNLINILVRSGIKKIEGDLLIDSSLYRKEPPLPRSERSYLAPSGSASFNWNSVAFYIRPGKTLKSPALVFSDPESPYIQIINKAFTGKKNKISIKRKHLSKEKEIFEVKGEIRAGAGEIAKYRNINQPALWLGSSALSFLKQRGIKLSGQVKKGVCSGACAKLAEWESRPLAFHSYNLMKYSSNFAARMLVSHLPLLEGEAKGDLRRGMRRLREYLKSSAGIKNFRLEDPSGFSRKNRFAPKDLLALLIRGENSFYSPEMLFSYPLAGGKGTLEKRLRDLPPGSFARAKTGSLSGVLGLAGWAGASQTKKRYAFVFIFNGPSSKSAKAQKLFDEIILSLLK